MTVTLNDQIAQSIQQKETEELLAIWVTNDRDQWSGVAFDAISQTLSERGIPIPAQGVCVPSPPRYKGVRGWLLFFCFSLMVLNPLLTIRSLGSSFEFDSGLFNLMPGLRTAFIIDVSFLVAVTAFGVYAGICLWRVGPRAVKMAKIFLWCRLAYVAIDAYISLATLTFIRSMADSPSANLGDAIKGIVLNVGYVVFWFSYLKLSKRVRATYVTQNELSLRNPRQHSHG